MASTPDEVCRRHSGGDIALNIKKINGTVLIEGTPQSLEFLAQVLHSMASSAGDCGFQIGPNGAGNVFFEESSELGIYVHRLPCPDEQRDDAMRKEAARSGYSVSDAVEIVRQHRAHKMKRN